MQKLSEELTWRGFINQTTYKDLSVLDGEPVKFYFGVDPSADSMQIGNLAAAMMVKTFAKHGHKAYLLVGGATGMIGDPDGKAQERDLLTLEQIDTNKKAIAGQYKQIFGEHSFELVDNYDWFKDFKYLDFLRDIGKHVPMRQMLNRDFVQSRLGESGSGISYAEFSYVLIQAYDFLHLYKEYGVTLQLCGSDQWGNSIAGVDLIRRETGGEANVYSMPLVVNKSTGQKFGKTEAGAVWLDPSKTSPTQFYQFWINVDDEGVENYLKIYTELSKEEIERTMAEFNRDRSSRLAQKILAREVTKLVHGQEAVAQAEKAAESLRNGSHEASSELVTKLPKEVAFGELADVLVASRLASSKSEARRRIESGGIYVNDQQFHQAHLTESEFQAGKLKLRRGKTLGNTAIIEIED